MKKAKYDKLRKASGINGRSRRSQAMKKPRKEPLLEENNPNNVAQNLVTSGRNRGLADMEAYYLSRLSEEKIEEVILDARNMIALSHGEYCRALAQFVARMLKGE